MTPTRAQIEAAAVAIAEAEGGPSSRWPNWTEASKNRFRELAALALTAAAEVEWEDYPFTERDIRTAEHVKAATIERCAQVADNYKEGGGAEGVSGIHKAIAAAIRALKDQP